VLDFVVSDMEMEENESKNRFLRKLLADSLAS
jgi:hypothetical protein